MGRSFRLPISTSSPSRKMIDRKPSHLGSKLYEPVGISATDLASMGATGGITGRRMHLSSPTPGFDKEPVTSVACPKSLLRWPGPAGPSLRSRSPADLQYAGLPAALPGIQRFSGHRQRTSGTRH